MVRLEQDIDVYRSVRGNIVAFGAAGKLVGWLFECFDNDSNGYLEESEGKRFLLAQGCAQEARRAQPYANGVSWSAHLGPMTTAFVLVSC